MSGHTYGREMPRDSKRKTPFQNQRHRENYPSSSVRENSDAESSVSSTCYMPTRPKRGTHSSYFYDNRFDRRRHQPDDSDSEPAMSISSSASTRSNARGLILPMAFPGSINRGDFTPRYQRYQRPRVSDAGVASSSSSVSSRFHRGSYPSVKDDSYGRREDRANRKVTKFILSSRSSRSGPSYSDDPGDGREFKVIYVGYKYIEGLTQKKPHEIVCEIVQPNSAFAVFLNEPELEADWLMLVVEILKNMCASSFAGNIHEMLNHVLRSQLMHALVYYLNDIETETNTETIAKMKTFVENLTTLLSSITNILPLIAVERNVKKVVTKTMNAIDKVNGQFQAGVEETYKKILETLILKLDNYKDTWEPKLSSSTRQSSSYQDQLSNMAPPDDFREISLHPTYEDLKSSGKFTFIRPNKVKGSYQDVNHYLDVQFRLLREDFIYPLRMGLKEYTAEKAAQPTATSKKLKSKYEGVRFYRNTKFVERSMTKSHDLGYTLAFDPECRLKINWSSSKRFMFGSLLLFTTNDFETFFYGTVLEKDEKLLRTGHIVVKLPLHVEITDRFFEPEYLLAESEVFFEPYFHVMRRLQTFRESEFPMPEFIIEGKVKTERPAYLKALQASPLEEVEAARVRNLDDPPEVDDNVFHMNEENEEAIMDDEGNEEVIMNDEAEELQRPVMNPPVQLRGRSWNVLGHSVDLTRDDQWPTAAEFKMDESQYEAFKTALTSNFCVIQGPPGTGKTYIGLKIVQVLLKNLRHLPDSTRIKSPILIVCYTNHALDQFLEGIVPFTSRIIRAGSRSNSEVLKNFNLRGANLRFIRRQAKVAGRAISSVREEVEQLYKEIQKLTELRDVFENPAGILKFELIESVMEDREKEYVGSKHGLMRWLLPQANDDFDYTWYDGKRAFRYDLGDVLKKREESKSAQANKDDFYNSDDGDELVDELLDLKSSDYGSIYCLHYTDFENIQLECERQMFRIEERMQTETNRAALSRLMNEKREAFYAFNCKVHEYELLCQQLASPHRFDAELRQKVLRKNIRRLDVNERWQLYWSWVLKVIEKTVNKLNETERKYATKLEQLNEYNQIEDGYVVERAEVVGMTTTCAARLHHVLETVKPSVVVIEEAAEVLESHIVASLTNACQQLIMIGDHKQLKPSAAVYHLCKTYNFDISLFERMINNGMYCPMLRVQHRMRPEISKLITPLIYPNLEDHESVRQFEPIKGVSKSMFFLEHTELEEQAQDSASRKNAFEADFMLKLCEYLVHQGYHPTRITILTTYSGQMFLLREKKRQYPALDDVRCIVVDKYQGEENDIVLLSLVRSNAEAKIGFLKTENRVCVALSRAKKGLYMIGNMDNLRASSPLWEQIHGILRTDEASGPEMQLYCEKHELHTPVSKASDFDKVSQGGCNMPCAELMKCGHVCPSICHKVEHEQIRCFEPCPRTCVRLHPCKQYCYEKCNLCVVAVNQKLPCEHEVTLACYIDENAYECEVIVDDVSPVCGHPIKRKCGESAEKTKCTMKCGARLECGHACPQTCHKRVDPDHLEFKCLRPCERLNEKCSMSHPCKKRCFEECGLCTVVVTMELPCGHEGSLPCFTDLNEHKCKQKCTKRCPDCDAACKKRCHETCGPCRNQVEKTIEECGHKATMACSQEAIRANCSEQCESLAPCGHKCKARCCMPCGSKRCTELTSTDLISALCGHNDFVRIPCHMQSQVDKIDREKLLAFCRAPCNTELKCGDQCAGTCGLCWQGRMHKRCQEDCRNVLICGHTCKVKCRLVCPPCKEDCGFKCEHSSCNKKCGVPCVKCLEKCKWQCKHLKCTRKCGEKCNRKPCDKPCDKILPCGDPCIGFCGEPCPTECRKHNPEIKDIVFGAEDEPDARFVKLNDCGHVIESTALGKHLQMPPEGGEIVVKACPLCKTPIVTTLRYKNIVRETYEHIINIKRKVFGNQRTLVEKGRTLLADFEALGVHHAQIIRSTNLVCVERVIRKFQEILVLNFSWKRQQITVSMADITALTFFHNAIQTILTSVKGLLDLAERNETTMPYRGRYRTPYFRGASSRKVIERRLDKSVFATKALALAQRLVEKIEDIFLRLSQQESEDISLEIIRLTKIVDYCSALRKFAASKDLEAVMAIRTKIEEILFKHARFVPEQREAIDRLFQELEKAMKADRPLTKEEKQMIHLAMSSSFHGGSQSKGHWFTCTRGHYYCITECGGANQLSNCPECGEQIGGQNHRYVPTFRVATDMDGAVRPAWSSGNDMRNYGRLF